MTEAKDDSEELALIYDRECPVCTAYSCSVGVDESHAAGVRRINARDAEHELVRQAKEAGLDLDDGMVVVHQGKLYHGADALNIMARMAPDRGFGNRLNKALVGVLQADDLHAHKRFVPAHFKKLQPMELNPHAALNSLLPVTPTVTRAENGVLTVTIPAMEHFGHNPRATHISVKAIAVFVQSSYQQAIAEASAPALLPAGQPAAETTLTIPAAKGAVCCVLLEVNSLVEENGRMVMLRNKKYTAAGVIAVLVKRAKRMKRRKFPHVHRGGQLAIRELPVAFFQRE